MLVERTVTPVAVDRILSNEKWMNTKSDCLLANDKISLLLHTFILSLSNIMFILYSTSRNMCKFIY